MGSKKRILQVKYKPLVQNDYFVSIGGDIYTIPAFLREKKRYPYYNELIDIENRIIKNGKHVLVYGASIGPFGNYLPAVNYYKNELSKTTLIICREYESVKYLKSLGLKNVTFLPDPAFLVHSNVTKPYSSERQYIGLNFSPLSFSEIYGKINSESILQIANLVSEISKTTGKKILLIPHVVSIDPRDDDLRFLKLLSEKTGSKLADTSNGFLGIKDQLQDCCMVASARMHCCVSAIVENIPTIFISYSQKSIGMCEYVYGDQKWNVSLKDIESRLIPLINEMYFDRIEISNKIKIRNKEILSYYHDHVLEIKKFLK